MRPIDADALMNELMKVRWAYQMLDNTQRADIAMGGLRNAEKKVEQAPTIDAVPAVRCKDCIYYQDNNDGYPHDGCRWRSDETPDATDFCSFAERKDDEVHKNS